MVDFRAKNEPGVVVIESERDLAKLQQWAALGKKYGMVQLVQLSHPGRQCPKGLNRETVAPSAVPFSPALATTFGTPRELREDEIIDIIQSVLPFLHKSAKKLALKTYSCMVRMDI